MLDQWVERVRRVAEGRAIVGVMGGGRNAAKADADAAERFAREVSARGVVVLTGGGPGIMAAACRGAAFAIGVLPGTVPDPFYPNPFVDYPVFTGLGSFDAVSRSPGRNLVNVLASDVIAAFRGQRGTTSEMRLAAEHERPLVLVGWGLDDVDGETRDVLAAAQSPVESIDEVDDAVHWAMGQLT